MKNGRFTLSGAIGLLMGLICVLVLGAVFYGAMAYQILGNPQQGENIVEISGRALLGIEDAYLQAEQTVQQEVGGESCTVTVRTYRTPAGMQIEAVSASPAAYIERLSQEGWTPQLITGFVLAGMDAVYSVRGGEGVLAARAGDRIFMLRAAADERTLYTLGARAVLE